jgi:hypothetical protein
MKRRSLLELDTVIDEILDRNPEFQIELDKIIKESIDDSLHSGPRSSRITLHSTMETTSANTDGSSRT